MSYQYYSYVVRTCEKRLTELTELACKVYDADIPEPNFEYRQFFGKSKCATGLYNHTDRSIAINSSLFKIEENEHELIPTLEHEFAHYIQYHVYNFHIIHRFSKRKPIHGKEFKKALCDLGLENTTYHKLDTTHIKKKKKVKRHVYECESCKTRLMLSTTRHNRLIENPNRYKHTCSSGGKLKSLGSTLTS